MITQTLAALAGAVLLSDPAAAPRPQDDFYAHVNAQWLAETEIPPHLPWISPFVENTLAIQGEVRAVIEDVVRDPDAFGAQGRSIAAYWTSLAVPHFDENMQSLRREFDRIGALDGPADIAGAMCRLHARHSDFDVNAITPGVTPVWLGVRARPDAPGRQVLHVEPAGLGLPDPAYYVEERFAQERSAYRAVTANVLRAVGVEASARLADAVLKERGVIP